MERPLRTAHVLCSAPSEEYPSRCLVLISGIQPSDYAGKLLYLWNMLDATDRFKTILNQNGRQNMFFPHSIDIKYPTYLSAVLSQSIVWYVRACIK